MNKLNVHHLVRKCAVLAAVVTVAFVSGWVGWSDRRNRARHGPRRRLRSTGVRRGAHGLPPSIPPAAIKATAPLILRPAGLTDSCSLQPKFEHENWRQASPAWVLLSRPTGHGLGAAALAIATSTQKP